MTRVTLNNSKSEINLDINKQLQEAEENTLEKKWINLVLFKEKTTRMLFKTMRNNGHINARILIKINDYKLQDGYVTVTVQITLQGLKDLNLITYNSVKLIKEHILEKDENKKDQNQIGTNNDR